MNPNREAEEDYKECKKTSGAVFLILAGATLLGVASGPVAAAIFASTSVCLEVSARPENLALRRLFQICSAFLAIGVASFV